MKTLIIVAGPLGSLYANLLHTAEALKSLGLVNHSIWTERTVINQQIINATYDE